MVRTSFRDASGCLKIKLGLLGRIRELGCQSVRPLGNNHCVPLPSPLHSCRPGISTMRKELHRVKRHSWSFSIADVLNAGCIATPLPCVNPTWPQDLLTHCTIPSPDNLIIGTNRFHRGGFKLQHFELSCKPTEQPHQSVPVH
jgi:hypothetical protein